MRRSLRGRRNLRESWEVEIGSGELVSGRCQDGGHAVFVRTGVLRTSLHRSDNVSWWRRSAEHDPAGLREGLAAFLFKPSGNVSAIGVCKAVPTANTTGRVVLAMDEISIDEKVETMERSECHRDLAKGLGRANDTQGDKIHKV